MASWCPWILWSFSQKSPDSDLKPSCKQSFIDILGIQNCSLCDCIDQLDQLLPSRLIPTLIFVILANTSLLIHLQDGPLWQMIAETERSFCRNNWWSNLLFVNNYVHVHDPCVQQSWFLATDFQLTILGMLIMFLITKYHRFVKQIFGVVIFLSFVVPGIVVYVNGFEGVMLVTPEWVYNEALICEKR